MLAQQVLLEGLIEPVVLASTALQDLRLHYAGVRGSGKPATEEYSQPLGSLARNRPEAHVHVFATLFSSPPNMPYSQVTRSPPR